MYDTMLIVDDSEMIREVLKVIFQNTYTIMEAGDGKEALEIIEACRENINIILLDLQMPGLSGLEILEQRKHIDYFKSIPVVVITGSNAIEDQIEAFEMGASDFIVKPFVPEIVMSRINNVMASMKRLQSILRESEHLKTKAELDLMTGLYNKVTTETLCEAILNTSPEKNHAFFIFDIDNFKTVNDTEGHQAGDQTIKIIANLIGSQFRESDIVGRIGGDEFVVLMTGVVSKDIARRKAQDIVRIMKYKPNLTLPANVSMSVGLCFTEGKEINYKTLFQRADESLYHSKKDGKARYSEYGVEKVEKEKDNRDAILLFSRDRDICGKMASVVENTLNLCEVGTKEELLNEINEIQGKIKLLCVDAVDDKDDSMNIWSSVKNLEKIKGVSSIVICQEGNMQQYAKALQLGAADILSAPLELDNLKRRMEKYIL